MPWINVKPANLGGGRKSTKPTATVSAAGLVTLSHATVEMLGEPDRVLVSYEPEQERIRLVPTTPTDNGAFALSGGGNSSYRFTARTMTGKHPAMAGEYIALKINGGVELRKSQGGE